MNKKATPKPIRRAVGYVRISVDRDDETSTDTQEERIRAYCVAQGWDIVEVVVEPGRSAYKASRGGRPGLTRAKGLIGSGAADVLVVWKLDRAARNTVDTLNLVDELAGYGAQLASVTEHFDTSTATGEMTLTVLAALARMESATKSERVLAWQDHRRANGATPTGPRPFGYRRERNQLIVDKAEAAMIRRAAKKVLAGATVRSLAADPALTKDGKPLSRRGLVRMLTAPTVVGCRESAPGVFLEGNWPPILDRETWDELRALLLHPGRRTSPGNARRFPLSGIATCGRCEDTVALGCRPHTNGEPRYYCPQCFLSIEQARTDDFVERALLKLLDKKTWNQKRRGRPPTGADTADFEADMNALTARFVAGDIDGVELANVAEGLRAQQETDATPPPPLPDVDDLRAAWPKLDLEPRRLVLSTFTESLVIRPWTPTHRFDETRVAWVPAV
jgi:site-specific DNA recombinase